MSPLKKADFIGAAVAIIFYITAILVFISRLLKNPQFGYLIGIFEFLLLLPLFYLLIKAPKLNRPALYYIQIIIIIIWLVIELLLDYIYKIDFRQMSWILILYVTLFFAGSGGMIGIASNAGKNYMVISVALFIIMTALAFIQRAFTGI